MLCDFFREFERFFRSVSEVPSRERKNDGANYVIFASYPKSGNTWLRFLFANISSLLNEVDADIVNFHTVSRFCPEIRGDRRLVRLGSGMDRHLPVFLKTHFPRVPGFDPYRVVLLFREPISVLKSYRHYMEKERGRKFKDNASFVTHWRYGVDAWIYFHQTWLQRDDVIFLDYDLVKSNTLGIVRHLYSSLGYDLDVSVLSEAIHRSSRDSMSSVLDMFGDPMLKNKNYKFIRTEEHESRADFSCELVDLIASRTKSVTEELRSRVAFL